MILKSKFRLDVSLSTISIVGIMLLLPYPAYLNITEKFDENYLKEPSIFLLLIFIGILYAGALGYIIYEIVAKTLIITINENYKTVLFNYPFKFKKKNYLFEEVIGFRFWSTYSAICDFKTLVIKTTDNRIHTVFENQIANFNQFEIFALDNFALKKGIDFKSLTTEEEIEELKNNQTFNIEQAKSYRTTCYFLIGLILLLLVMNAFLAIPERKFGWAIYGFLSAFFIFFCIK